MFIAGNDRGAKREVATLLGAFGWSVIDLGDVHNALARGSSLRRIVYHPQTGQVHHALELLGK